MLSVVLLMGSVQGFSIVTWTPQWNFGTLFAIKKRRAEASSSGGGFGGGTANKKHSVGDYDIFPALEPRVRETFVPVKDDAVGLSPEIYQRLDQIYGFPSFNYAGEEISSSVSTSSPLDYLLDPTNGASNEKDKVEEDSLMDLSSDLQLLPAFGSIRVLHVDPMVIAIDDFFTSDECDRYVNASQSNRHILQSRSPTVGKDATAKAQRTSTTFYHPYQHVPELMSKASRLLGLQSIDCWEEPQTVRYRKNEKFTWHLDALGPLEQQSSPAGQRIVTLLVYLTSLERNEGGATLFRDLRSGTDDESFLRVQPKKGMALLFFPSAGGIVDCPFDIRTLHCGGMVSSSAAHDKWIAQLWLRQRQYSPTAPPGNRHEAANEAISDFCRHGCNP